MNHIQMVAKFYDARDKLRTALGHDRYEHVAAPLRDRLRRFGDDWFNAAMKAGKSAMDDGEADFVGLLLAVVADLADEEDAGRLPHQARRN